MTTILLSPARPRDASRTRAAILQAAQTLFAEKGYATTGVREVAAEAGVNSALVRRYFGSKEGLLRVALLDVLQIAPFIDGDRDSFGVRAVSVLLDGERSPNPLAMMILATVDPAARSLCAELLHERVLLPLADWLGGPDAMDRTVRMQMLWVGFMTSRRILPSLPLVDHSAGPTRQWLEQLTQSIVDGGGSIGR